MTKERCVVFFPFLCVCVCVLCVFWRTVDLKQGSRLHLHTPRLVAHFPIRLPESSDPHPISHVLHQRLSRPAIGPIRPPRVSPKHAGRNSRSAIDTDQHWPYCQTVTSVYGLRSTHLYCSWCARAQEKQEDGPNWPPVRGGPRCSSLQPAGRRSWVSDFSETELARTGKESLRPGEERPLRQSGQPRLPTPTPSEAGAPTTHARSLSQIRRSQPSWAYHAGARSRLSRPVPQQARVPKGVGSLCSRLFSSCLGSVGNSSPRQLLRPGLSRFRRSTSTSAQRTAPRAPMHTTARRLPTAATSQKSKVLPYKP